MTTAPVSTTFAHQTTPIHHAVTFTYDSPTTCGRVEQPKPSASEWRYVTCEACLAAGLLAAARDALSRNEMVTVFRGEGYSTGMTLLGADDEGSRKP